MNVCILILRISLFNASITHMLSSHALRIGFKNKIWRPSSELFTSVSKERVLEIPLASSDMRRGKNDTCLKEGNNGKIVIKSSKNSSKKQSIDSKLSRFILGNGNEAITASNLIDQVKSTAPFYFPSEIQKFKEVLEEDDEDENITYYPSNKNLPNPHNPSSLVNNATSLLDIALSGGPTAWQDILLASHLHPSPSEKPTPNARIDYFVLCLASHFSSVATYVPTDVDSKIRGHCWQDPDESVIMAQFAAVEAALAWDVRDVSAKFLLLPSHDDSPLRILSGHSGEWLGVLCGAMGRLLGSGDFTRAQRAESWIESELQKEATAFRELCAAVSSGDHRYDTTLLKAASIITHNVGDVDQGLSYWGELHNYSSYSFTNGRNLVQEDMIRNKYSRLAHDRPERYEGQFIIAKQLYKELIAAEGHRNYPLRDCKAIRNHRDLLLPLGPWLEEWGHTVATHDRLSDEDKATVVRQLLRGCDSTSRAWCVPNQVRSYCTLRDNGLYRTFDFIFDVITALR